MKFEAKNMYYSYTVTKNSSFKELSSQINPLIDSIIVSNTEIINLENLETYSYMDEDFIDLLYFLQVISDRSKESQQKYHAFLDFANKFIIHKVRDDGELFQPLNVNREEDNVLSGLGLFLPTSKQELEKYRYLSVYSDLKLIDLFDAVIFNSDS